MKTLYLVCRTKMCGCSFDGSTRYDCAFEASPSARLIHFPQQQVYYVKAISDAPAGELDLNRADDEQFPPEKLRMTLERFYMSVVVGLSGFFKHVARLRSWKEPLRTFAFCTV